MRRGVTRLLRLLRPRGSNALRGVQLAGIWRHSSLRVFTADKIQYCILYVCFGFIYYTVLKSSIDVLDRGTSCTASCPLARPRSN